MRESLTMTPHHRISLSTPKERRAEKHHPHPPYFSLPVVLTWGEASGVERYAFHYYWIKHTALHRPGPFGFPNNDYQMRQSKLSNIIPHLSGPFNDSIRGPDTVHIPGLISDIGDFCHSSEARLPPY